MISLDEGVGLVETAFSSGHGGEIFVKKNPSMGIMDIAEAVDPGGKREIIGQRPGEKIHEQMIGPEDSASTWEFEDHFRIVSPLVPASNTQFNEIGGTRVPEGFSYTSDQNSDWMSIDQLRDWLVDNTKKMLKI